jgi:hypothetical protein
MTSARRFHATLAVLTLILYACGGQDKPKSDEPAEAVADTATTAPAPSNAGPAPLTVADIDRWERGIAGELEAVHAAAAKLKEAKTGNDSITAMMGVQEMTTLAAGAKAAGVDNERYNLIRTDLSAAAGYLAPSVGGIDTTMLSPEQREEMRKGNEAQLEQMKDRVPPDVVKALAPRAAELRKKDLELVAARLKGAGV